MKILGINSAYHELAAALVIDGRVVVAIEEERLSRIKHGKAARVDNPHEMPVGAIRLCLERAGVRAEELDAVCYSFDPALRRETFRLDPLSKRGDWGDAEGEEVFLAALGRVPEAASETLGSDVRKRFRWVPHHLAHAASTFYPSGFGEAAVLVVDGIGESASTVIAGGRGASLTRLEAIQDPHSLGFLWEKLSKHMGFSEYDACKVMGLAGYGDPLALRPAFERFVSIEPEGYRLNPEVLAFRLDDFAALEQHLGPARDPGQPIGDAQRNIAAALQAITTEIILALARRARRLFPAPSLCLAGGVALNCTSNQVLKEQGPFERIYIPSAPHDAGTAVGAALYVHHAETGAAPGEVSPMPTPYAGPSYSDEEIRAVLTAEGVPFRRCDDIAAEVAALIAGGQVVGWFQGAMEFGPRALGNRSLLADPRDRGMREMLNVKVKHRETFRPFAPSVLEERSEAWFELGRPSWSQGAMLFACPVRPHRLAQIPAVTHVDGTARVQVVRRGDNPIFHRLIACFEQLTGVPLVLNTSFNDSEPIVCSPRDALATFRSTRIDALAMGNLLVTR